jgi:hypothetical protein
LVPGSDMSGKVYCNPVIKLDKSGWGLSHSEERIDRTCPFHELNMFGNLYWIPAMDPDKSGELRKTGWPGHVWAEGQTCPVLLTGI